MPDAMLLKCGFLKKAFHSAGWHVLHAWLPAKSAGLALIKPPPGALTSPAVKDAATVAGPLSGSDATVSVPRRLSTAEVRPKELPRLRPRIEF